MREPLRPICARRLHVVWLALVAKSPLPRHFDVVLVPLTIQLINSIQSTMDGFIVDLVECTLRCDRQVTSISSFLLALRDSCNTTIQFDPAYRQLRPLLPVIITTLVPTLVLDVVESNNRRWAVPWATSQELQRYSPIRREWRGGCAACGHSCPCKGRQQRQQKITTRTRTEKGIFSNPNNFTDESPTYGEKQCRDCHTHQTKAFRGMVYYTTS